MLGYIRYFFSNIPSYLIFYITGKCNANCIHCFNWKLSNEDLTLEEIEKIATNWGKLLILNLGGGEPFLRDDIVDIVSIFDKYTKVPIIAIPTNGILTAKIIDKINEILTLFPHIFFRFTISIDGLGKEHDTIRGIKCFDHAISTIRYLKHLKRSFPNFTLLTNSCFMQQNQNTLLNTIQTLKEGLGVDFPSVTYIRGDARDLNSKVSISLDKYIEIINYLETIDYSEFTNHPMSKFLRKATLLARRKVVENIKTGERNFKCYCINKMIVMENNGRVRVCESQPWSLGNLRNNNYDIKEIINSYSAKATKIYLHNKNCNCTWECAIRTGIIYNPLEWGKLL